MGLDFVEFVLTCEEQFGVQISDDEVLNCETPRILGDTIFAKLQRTEEGKCQTQRAFYLLRRAFLSTAQGTRESISPATPLRELIPKGGRGTHWDRLRQAVRARRWPELCRPTWLFVLLLFPPVLVSAATAYIASTIGPFAAVLGVFAAVPVLLSCAISEAALTRPLRTHVPSHLKCIRDLVPYALTSDELKWTRGQVSQLVRQIVIKQLGVPEAKYHEDLHFFRDLRIDA